MSLFDMDLSGVVNNLFNHVHETSSRDHENHESRKSSSIPVTVEDENTLVIKSNGKRKRQEGEDEGCKYLRLERRAPQKLLRKFRLPENANVSAITAKCENGVLTVVVEKHTPPPKSKTVEVAIA
ncbi:hypothetical protein TSUD_359070 [Trifolium subterraneum]|uniref:SHSP domain-containing protein n=1 Tax=Trifolium subterraneum TaxID=3900 RepID=A0A2Z6N5A2_TRISU|nr:hypothetical protein TSUD_359070 [Trifolium subterraneum]